MLDRTVAPLSGKIEQVEIKQAETVLLDNGVPLHIIKAGSQPIIRIELLINGGNWFEPGTGVSFLTTKMLSEGTKHRSAADINKIIENYGANLELTPGLDQIEVTLTCLTRYFQNLLPLLREMIFEAVFPEQELQTIKNIKIQTIRVDNQKNNIVASKQLRKKLFGTIHPYGRILTESDVEGVERKTLVNYHSNTVLNNYEIVVSGDFKDEYIKVFNQNFGQNQLQRKKPSTFYPVTPDDQKTYVHKDDALQSAIRLGKITLKKQHKDYIDLLIANEILGGYFGSRLMTNIREEKGYTYGIYSHIYPLHNDSFFLISTEAVSQYTKPAVDEIYKELKRLRSEPVGTDELESVKSYMIGAFLNSIDTPFNLADKFKSINLFGLDYDYFDRYLKKIHEITPERIMEVTNTYLHEDGISEVIIGKL